MSDPIPSPEERLILSLSSSVFSSVFLFLGPGTDSNCAGIRSYIIRCSLRARNSRTLGSQLHSDFDLFSFRDCLEKDNRITFSFIFYHFLFFFHFLLFSSIFFHFLSFSFIFLHVLSFSFIFFFLYYSFSLLGAQNLILFGSQFRYDFS